MKNQQNPYIYATFSALIGTVVYIIIKYLLIKQFDLATTIIIAIILWVGGFIGQKYLAKSKFCK